jgi:hypothetical protein
MKTRYGDSERRTVTVEKTLAPVWTASNRFAINIINPVEVIDISMLDEDWGHSSDFMGQVGAVAGQAREA